MRPCTRRHVPPARGAAFFGLLAVLSAVGSSTRADEPEPSPAPPTAVVAKAMSRPVPRAHALAPEAKPSPNLRLTLEAPTTRGRWKMRVVNDGEIPVRVVADARLLNLDVTPRGARSPVRCELPADMRSTSDLERALIVPAKRAYAEDFEPRLYCFGTKLDALAPGAVVVAHLGYATGGKAKPPFASSPIEGVEPEVAPLKSIDAAPIALPDEPSPWTATPPAPQGADLDLPRLTIRGSAAVDAMTPHEIEIPITLRNESLRTVVVRFRPEVLGFDVTAQNGVDRCSWPTLPAAPLREMFTTLGPKASETIDVNLSAYCTGAILNDPGLLLVRPWLDTRNAAGAVVGLRTFDGAILSITSTVVRLHRGAAPPGPLRPPELEP